MAVFLLFLCWIFDESTVSAGVAAPTHRRCVSSFFLFFLFFLFFPLPTSFRLLAASCGQKKSIDGVARSLILFLYHFFFLLFYFQSSAAQRPAWRSSFFFLLLFVIFFWKEKSNRVRQSILLPSFFSFAFSFFLSFFLRLASRAAGDFGGHWGAVLLGGWGGGDG